MNTRRIGVLGGMFDPVHLGHLQVASVALEELALDELRMVPCHLPNHRGPAAASAQARLDMLQLAVGKDSRILVDDRECRQDSISYTVETLRSLHQECPAATLVLVLGADAFAGLERWHCWQTLFTLAHLLVVSRPGEFAGLTPALTDEVRKREVRSVGQLFAQPCGALLFSRHLQVDISSTAVRAALQTKRATTTLLPPAVQDYIAEHGLYAAQTHNDFQKTLEQPTGAALRQSPATMRKDPV